MTILTMTTVDGRTMNVSPADEQTRDLLAEALQPDGVRVELREIPEAYTLPPFGVGLLTAFREAADAERLSALLDADLDRQIRDAGRVAGSTR